MNGMETSKNEGLASAIDAHTTALVTLEKIIDVIVDSLEPVMRSQNPAEDASPKSMDGDISDMRSKVEQLTIQLRRAHSVLASVSVRLDL